MHRKFHLVRTEDVSGVSGTGIIAEGVEWTGGRVRLHWLGTHSTFEDLDNIKEVTDIHGHDGKTHVEWLERELS